MADKAVIEFAKLNRVGVVATIIGDNKPHVATVHYAFNEGDFSFFFVTKKDSVKMSLLVGQPNGPASMAVGFSEEEWVTLQMDGVGSVLPRDSGEWEEGWKVYLEKFPQSKRKADEEFVLVKFTPNWWRYSELKSVPKKIISSEE